MILTRFYSVLTSVLYHPTRLLWLTAGILFLYLASIPVHLNTQAIVVICLILLLWVATRGRFQDSQKPQLMSYLRTFVIAGAVFITMRYFFWRTFTTIEYADPFSFAAALLLYAAEVYGIIIYLLGAFVNISPLKRKPLPLPADPKDYPTVDIMIPSYNEDAKLLEITLMAATQVNYPAEKLNVYLLDDGGTVQKRADSDPEKSAEAWQRHRELQELCKNLGATYLTRDKNEHAKAGNVNSALKHSKGEIILILDADHVPTVDILQKTIGFFVQDPKLFLVQTPHFFINPDPIERNLDTFEQMPGENEMFYTVIQHGLDFWNASFFCGSAALLRRCYLEENGGISGQTITEDAETALGLHEKGYRSIYLGEPLIAGLQPETFSGFILQRVRWAQGMVQIFLLKNPWLMKNLSFNQRLAYTSSSFFWFFPFARTIFLLAPAAFLLFGLQIYAANLQEFFFYALPHVLASILLSNFLFGKTRWPFISELYETMQSIFSLVAIAKVFRNPHAPQFNVTPKGEHLEKDFISSLAIPFYILITITLVCISAATFRYINYPLQQDVAIITGAWATFNLILLFGALGALFERRQRRQNPRIHIPMNLHAHLILDNIKIPCEVVDVSATGVGVYAPASEALSLSSNTEIELMLNNKALSRTSRLHTRIQRVITDIPKVKNKRMLIGLEFNPHNLTERREIVALVFGNSTLLKESLKRRQHSIGAFRALGFLLKIGIRHSFGHLKFLINPLSQFVASLWKPKNTKSNTPETVNILNNLHTDKILKNQVVKTTDIIRESA